MSEILNATQAVMLGLFGEQTLTGNDLCDIGEKYMSPYWSMTRSQIYRELKTLEDYGLIESVELPLFRNRRHFKITDAGAKAFQSWITQPVESPDPVRNSLALRVAFADYLTDEQFANVLDEGIRNTQQEITRIQNMRKLAWTNGLDWDDYALRLSELQAQATLKWLREVKQAGRR